MLLCGSPEHPDYRDARADPLKPDKSELTRATKKEVRVEGRGSTGTEEVRMLCGPPGTY